MSSSRSPRPRAATRRRAVSSLALAALVLPAAALVAGAKPAGATSVAPPKSPTTTWAHQLTHTGLLLRTDGLKVVRFTEHDEWVTKTLTAKLGPPTEDKHVWGCMDGVDRLVYWKDLYVAFSHGAFVGYSYGLDPGPGYRPALVVKTPSGIGLSSKVRDIKRVYPSARAKPVEGGTVEWTVTVKSGSLGIATIAPGDEAGRANRVYNIHAGTTCS